MSLIRLFRDNLTKLTVSWNLTKDTLGTVLSLCPNLEYFHLSNSHDITFQPLQSPPPSGYRLRRLYLQSENDEDILEDLLSHCPRLEALAAIDINADILDLIDRCCPLLRYLNANSYEDPPHWGPDDAYDSPHPPGLYTLNFNTYSDTPMRDCLSTLNKSKDTLRMLGLKLYDTVDDQQLRFGLSQLTTLRLRINEGRFGTAESIIRQSPMLEVVSLNFRASRAPDHFLMCLETRARLRDLSLIEFDMNSQDFQLFFDHCASQYQSCALQSISLLECEEGVITDKVLTSLANITTLRRIDLIEALESTTYKGIVAFIEQLHRLPQLETIRLRELDEINNDMIVQIAKIDGLRALYLCDMGGITSSGVRALADNASSTLRDVSIIHCSGVNDKATKYLYRKVLSNAHHFIT
ncbi:hypothetical protein BJV82DRAFT_10428 [Fennellomyces sp. T-0311]|nr:hypothetical protein BJV82DRAFT_10428 [Fennellomyces sp. T-0311]